MRFYEFEAREVVKRAGIPVTDYGFTTDPAEAATIAGRIGGQVGHGHLGRVRGLFRRLISPWGHAVGQDGARNQNGHGDD